METFLDSLLSFLLLYKYVALFCTSFLAAFLLPLPSSSILAAAGAFASQGYFSLTAVLLVAFVGNIGGDITGYLLSRRYGEELLGKIGFKKILHSDRYHSLESYIIDFSYSLIFFSRFLVQIGPSVNILSGLARVPYRTFFVIAVIGEIFYVLLYGLVGYSLGSAWENNIGFMTEAGLTVLSLGVVIALIQYGLFRFRRRR